MEFRLVLAFSIFSTVCFPVFGYESDVHYGLTKWLALKAGYSEEQSEYIALGNQRVDSGIMDTIQLKLEYACLGRHVESAKVAQAYHHPSKVAVPNSPSSREVKAGRSEASSQIASVFEVASDRNAEHLLMKLGEAIHLFQDSWSYQGIPDVPRFEADVVKCDPDLVFSAPKSRGGFNSHNSDLTWIWPEDSIQMAMSTYQVLVDYRKLVATSKAATSWDEVRPHLFGFVNARSKSDKSRWFDSQGISDRSFLEMISLPDGGEAFSGLWNGRKLAPLNKAISRQYLVETEIKAFYEEFFGLWLGSEFPSSAIGKPTNLDQKDLAARLIIWRIRDHGLVASMAHQRARLNRQQLEKVNQLSKKKSLYVKYAELKDAFFPLLEQGPGVSPLLPYVIHKLPATESGNPRAIAVTKLKHVPYDELGIVAEKQKGSWKITQIITLVNH